ncbi:hypothetical protein AB0M28_00850 [Streptomyces sp. NPDC051940]|uniref:hypothetical protein n=1 Tax=Streptomyces sp. NPDC051940 TaxID=3155675 RepID=UPI003437CDEF
MTRDHIEVWNHRVLPPGGTRIQLRTLVHASLLPIVVWLSTMRFAYSVYQPVAIALAGSFALFVLWGFLRRRKVGHSTRCCLYGAVGGVLDKSMPGR